ncbi:MAG: hypothetical protein JXR97_14515 [Planctomycetes bacterium]|nr:hypothetical protein [Planctomycetota bacterium]
MTDESKYKGLGYEELETRLQSLSVTDLASLLNSPSVKIGDVAAGIMTKRNAFATVISCIMDGKISRKIGKIRCLNILTGEGKKCHEAVAIYLYLLQDRSWEVVYSSLWALVFLQDKKNLTQIKELLSKLPEGSDKRKDVKRAILALEEQNPFIFSPNFHDRGNVWELNHVKFSDHIG